MKQKVLNYIMLFVFVYSLVFTTPAFADGPDQETPAPAESLDPAEVLQAIESISTDNEQPATSEPVIESTLTEEPVAQATDTPIEEETLDQLPAAPEVIEVPIVSTPTPNQILGLEEPAQPEDQSIEQGEMAEANVEMPEGQNAEVQVEMVQAQCNDGEIVCVPNPDVTEVIVEILVNDEAEDALEEMIEDAENGTPIEDFEIEVDVSRRYEVEVGDYITIYNERTGSTIIAVVTDCRLGVYISIDPLIVVSSDGEVIEETHIREDESFLDITIPDGETVSVTIDIPGRHEDPVTITVTGICQSCNVVTQTATNTATPTATDTNTATATSTATSTVTATNTVTPSPTATNTATATATSVQVCDDEDAENYGDPMPCIYPTNTSTPTLTSTPVTETPTAPSGTPTGTATAITPVITPTQEVIEENGEEDKEEKSVARNILPGVCTMDGEYIITKIENTIYVKQMDGEKLLNKYSFEIPLEGESLNERITAIECQIYFSWVVKDEAQSDLYRIGFTGGAIHRVTNTPAINEMDPAIFGNDLSFTAQYDDGHVNVETTNLDGSHRHVSQSNAFAPAYDITGLLTWSNSPIDDNNGVWHTYAPDNSLLHNDMDFFYVTTKEGGFTFGADWPSAYYRPDGKYMVAINDKGDLLVYPVDADWTPTGDPISLDQTDLQFAIWVDFGPE